MKTDRVDKRVQGLRRSGEDGRDGEATGEKGLELANSYGRDGVFSLGGEHEGNKGVETRYL